ncbi:MAG: cobalt ABC transporter permease [Cohaesibacter sp.]|nr:cobalt ABC transporter permease [Cohaesibacter sp.]
MTYFANLFVKFSLTFSLALTLAIGLFVGAFALSSPALAHKVIASAYADGDAIEGEIGFSNGTMAKNVVVEVLDDSGAKLGEVTTDEEGIFRYQPTKAIALTFRADLGQGHVALYRMTEDELPQMDGASVTQQTSTPAPSVSSQDAPSSSNTAALGLSESAIASLVQQSIKAEMAALQSDLRKAVRLETKPLRKEIAAYKEKNDLQTILGGVGYIIGLFGIGFYVVARREANKVKKVAS